MKMLDDKTNHLEAPPGTAQEQVAHTSMRSRMRALFVAALVALVSVALCVATAGAVNPDKKGTLQVKAPLELPADISKDMQIYIYKVADINHNFTYSVTDEFTKYGLKFDEHEGADAAVEGETEEERAQSATKKADSAAGFWAGVAQDAYKALQASAEAKDLIKPVYPVDLDDPIKPEQILDGVPTGMYLIVITPIVREDYIYSFQPSLVTVPFGNATSDDNLKYGTQDDPIAVYPKWERITRYGELEIIKTLKTYNDTDPSKNHSATFVYDIKATRTVNKTEQEITAEFDKLVTALVEAGEIEAGETISEEKAAELKATIEPTKEVVEYSNVVMINFDKPGQKSALVKGIPATTKVTVTEVYSGATYELISDPEQTAVIVADDVEVGPIKGIVYGKPNTATVDFTNDYTGEDKQGSGIQNEFTFVDGQWVLTPVGPTTQDPHEKPAADEQETPGNENPESETPNPANPDDEGAGEDAPAEGTNNENGGDQ